MRTVGRLVAYAAVGGLLAAMAPNAVSFAGPGREEATQINRLTIRVASNPDQVVNVAGDSKENGAQLIQYPLSNTLNELWEPEASLDGYYRFKSVSSGKCINVAGGGNDDGTPVIQYTCGIAANELWRFVQKGIGYQLQVKSSGKCLNVKGGVGSGNQLIQYTCTANGVPNDVWLPTWEPTR